MLNGILGLVEIRNIVEDSAEYIEAKRLYESSFPENERGVFEKLFVKPRSSIVLGFYENDMFVGFLVLFVWKDIAHIVYFAIEEKLRDLGYGSKVIKALSEEYGGYRLIADLEKDRDDAPNMMQRKRRLTFYHRNGFHETDIEYEWHGDSYVILINKGEMHEKEFDEFWDGFDLETNNEIRGF